MSNNKDMCFEPQCGAFGEFGSADDPGDKRRYCRDHTLGYEMALWEVAPYYARCIACGGPADKGGFTADTKIASGFYVNICGDCIEAKQVDAQLAERAAELEERARRFRSLVGRLRIPDHKQWLAADESRMATYQAAFRERFEACQAIEEAFGQ